MRADDLRVATIGYRLGAAGLPICRDHAPLAGLLVHDASQYAGAFRPAAERLFNLAAGPGVEAVVAGGPADRAGIRAGDRLTAIDGADLSAAPPRRRPNYDAVARVQQALAAALHAGPARLTLDRGGVRIEAMLEPVEGCASLVQLVPSNRMNASADGRTVTVTTALTAFATDDDELAVIVAHELAHNALRHRERLDAEGVTRGMFAMFGSSAGRIRAAEREADYVSTYLLARAGYDVTAAPRFWERFGRSYGLGILSDGTHPSTSKRVRLFNTAIAEIAARRARGEPLLPGPVPPED